MNENVGTIIDSEIMQLCNEAKLIIENFNTENIKQACYELRASNIYYENAENNRRIILKEGDYILLKPKQLTVVITMEKLNLPADIMGRILTKGQLFSIGIIPVNTYADPGFIGQLGIVLYNLSNDYLKLFPGQPIAKIEFSRLANCVKSPYHGQHGYDSKIWPRPDQMILTKNEIKKDRRIKSISEELVESYGKDLAGIINKVFRYERRLILSTIAFCLFSVILLGLINYTYWANNLVNYIINILGSIGAVLLVHYGTNITRK